MAQGMTFLDDQNFESSIAQGVTLVDFYADWCGPCKTIAPLMEELSHDYNGKALIAKLDVDKAQVAASKHNVTSIPTVILFVNGKEVKRVVGVRDKKTFQTMIDASL
jgi:thioredoxin 1